LRAGEDVPGKVLKDYPDLQDIKIDVGLAKKGRSASRGAAEMPTPAEFKANAEAGGSQIDLALTGLQDEKGALPWQNIPEPPKVEPPAAAASMTIR